MGSDGWGATDGKSDGMSGEAGVIGDEGREGEGSEGVSEGVTGESGTAGEGGSGSHTKLPMMFLQISFGEHATTDSPAHSSISGVRASERRRIGKGK